MSVDLGEFHKTLRTMLTANAGVTARVGQRIYDATPQNVAFPHIEIGDLFTGDRGAECIEGTLEVTFDLHVWSRARGSEETKTIMRFMHEALHMPDGLPDTAVSFDLASIRVERQQTIPDRDGLTNHGVVTVTALLVPN